jgi:DNA-binding protein YbaB
VSDDSAQEWVRSWMAATSERAAAAQALSDRVAQLTASASDRDGFITVTVNGSGVLTDLRLAPEAARLGMERLGDEIVRTMRRAQARLAERVSDIAAQTVGPDSETARAVVSGFERRFPAEPEVPPHGG